MIPSHSNGVRLRCPDLADTSEPDSGPRHAPPSRAKADEALKQITSGTLLGEEAWTRTENSARAGVHYVEARGTGGAHR